ncbi:TraB subfamily protein [Acanthamoeba castellanii str. Neff]|uniref:TraB subfamily protein n=1 Tax=Acanthamoeba castellanii (strain ATCC 30010 / Neff) TaxID=1257118 RepID=L8GWM3_ACACF|nr:TraB subfamily protein [Acanthamoeba castellanii str. Neff]ELR16496.1 TraB subfamily protein [Acanthamoeba castellanii str. Neff]
METTQREQIADESEQQQQQQQQQERPLAEYLRKLEERAKEKRTTGEKDDSEEEEEDEEPRRYIIGDREVELPRSVIHLKSRNGGDVFLIGSAHVSQASVDDVTQPTTVFVELCPSRAGILFAPQQQPAPPPTADTIQQQQSPADGAREQQTESQQTTNAPASSPIVAATVVQAEKAPSTMSQISELLRRRKEGANILHLIISMVFERVTKNIKVMPGSEFRAAAQEGMKYGARIVLGDRPVEITLKRTWGNLSVWEKLKLLYFVLMDTSLDIKEEDIKRMKNSDIITEMVKELSTEFPSLVGPLITKQDQFLACKLHSCPGNTIGYTPLAVIEEKLWTLLTQWVEGVPLTTLGTLLPTDWRKHTTKLQQLLNLFPTVVMTGKVGSGHKIAKLVAWLMTLKMDMATLLVTQQQAYVKLKNNANLDTLCKVMGVYLKDLLEEWGFFLTWAGHVYWLQLPLWLHSQPWGLLLLPS